MAFADRSFSKTDLLINTLVWHFFSLAELHAAKNFGPAVSFGPKIDFQLTEAALTRRTLVNLEA